jgi:NAD-dependent DNA ligase
VSYDANEQPAGTFQTARNQQKSIDELIGLAKGLLADNFLHPAEVDFLVTWLKANEHISNTWPANVLFERIARAIEDGIIDEEERKEIFDILQQLSGDQLEETCSTPLPLDSPQPKVNFQGSVFCVTGKFAYGPRKEVEKIIIERGGKLSGSVTQSIDYLVIGTFSSRDWLHSSYGRKIEKAVEYRGAGFSLVILSEDQFIKCAFS